MKRFKLMVMAMNRFRLLLLIAIVMAVTTFTALTYAAEGPAVGTATDQQDAAAKQKTKAQADKARAQRADVLKKRQDAQKFIKDNATGHQPAADVATPDNGGAK